MSKRQRKQQDRTLLITGIVVAVAVVAVVALVLSGGDGGTAADPECAELVRLVNEGGMTTTASGLQYKVLTQGDGPMPSATSFVTVNYRGCLTTGTEFDSSYSRGRETSFSLNEVIDGWTEGLQLMPAGSSYLFYIPSEIAYGAAGRQGSIPPNAPLIFEITLLGFQ